MFKNCGGVVPLINCIGERIHCRLGKILVGGVPLYQMSDTELFGALLTIYNPPDPLSALRLVNGIKCPSSAWKPQVFDDVILDFVDVFCQVVKACTLLEDSKDAVLRSLFTTLTTRCFRIIEPLLG